MRVLGRLWWLISGAAVIITVVLGGLAFWDRLAQFFMRSTRVVVAFTPHGVDNDRRVLEKRYREAFVDRANHDPAVQGRYWFVVHIPGDTYDSVFTALKDGDALLGFMSPFNYLLLKHGKQSQYSSSEFQVVGALRPSRDDFYLSGFVVSADCDLVRGLDDLTNEKFTSGKLHFVLGDEITSTSTYRVPLIFLQERGILLNLAEHSFEKAGRWNILDRVRQEQCTLGAFSEDDWATVGQARKAGLRYFAIRLPIPFDPLLVYTSKWNGVASDERAALLKALTNTGSVREAATWSYQAFEDYVASGVVIGRQPASPGRWEVVVPDGIFDLYDLARRWATGRHAVRLWRPVTGVQTAPGYNLKEKTIGTCSLAMTDANLGSLECPELLGEVTGAHCLPI